MALVRIFITVLVACILLGYAADASAHGDPEHPSEEGENDHSHKPAHRHGGVHVDLGAGYLYALNGFIVPAPLVGGLEDGHGAWAHLGLHPEAYEWLEVNCGVDIADKGSGNLSWGIHGGVVFSTTIAGALRLGIGPFLGYHGERRFVTLSGQKLQEPETLSSFIVGVNPVVEVRLGSDHVWAVAEAEIGIAPPGSHRYPEWDTALKSGVKISF